MNYDGMSAQEIGEAAGVKWKGKSKENLIKEVESQTMPEFTPDLRKLDPTQQRVAGYVQTAKKDAPKPSIELIKENFSKIEMEVPKEVTTGMAEYSYAWLSIEDLASAVYPGSKWEIVTRNNHSHVNSRTFGDDGAITYKGQNILAFCYRYVQEAENEAIVSDFNAKTEQMTDTKSVVSEGAARVDPSLTGKVFEQQVLNPDEEFDFQAPQ